MSNIIITQIYFLLGDILNIWRLAGIISCSYIWKSTNGGSTWSIVGHWYGAGSTPYVHADHHDAIFRPNTSELYVGTDGGVYKTTNGGASWSDLNDGMNISQYYKISQSTSDTSLIVAGAQDNGI